MRRSFVLVPLLCFALSALVAVSVASAAPPLVGQWPLDASVTSGGSDLTEDVSGNSLTLSSAANTMKFGTALGKFGGYLSNANTTTLQVNSPLLAQQQVTLLAWIKQNGNPGTLRYIAGRGNDGPTCSGSSYALYTGYPAKPGLRFYVRQPGPEAASVLSEAPPDASVFDNNWHLVAGTFDGANMHLFVDGNQVGPAEPASGISYTAPITDPSFYVDGYPPQAGCIGIADFPGQIDEVRVYDRALSAAELGRLAAAPGPVPPALEPDAGAQPGPGPAPQPVGPTPGKLGVTLSKPGTSATTSTSRITLFKLDTSGPVSSTLIKLDGKPVFNVPSSTSTVGLNLGKVGEHLITATSLGIGGATASASTNLTVKPSTSSGGVLTRPKFLPDTGFFTPAEESGALLEALKNSQCVPDSTVVFGVMEAHGCFRKILPTPEELPRGEKGAAEEYLSTQILLEGYTVRPCRMEDPTCHTDYAKAFQKDPALQPFVSADDVRVNGMTIEPIGSATVLVFPAIKRVISSNAKISFDGGALGKFPVRPTGPVNLDLSTNAKYFTSGDAELSLFSFDTSQEFDDIGGFPINGTVGIAFERRSGRYLSSLKVNLSLPDEITTAAGANPTARVEVGADNARGTYLDLLNIHLGEAFLGPVELANVDFTYNDGGNPEGECPRKWWKATAEVFFVPVETGQQGAGLKMAPEPQRNGIAFCAGEFHSAGAALRFGYPFLPPPVLFPGVTLNEIGFSFQLHKPVVIDGYATIHAAEIVNATGGFLAAFATPGHPYTFKPGDAGGTLRELQGQTFGSTTFAVGGTVNIEPGEGVGMELGNAHLVYSYPGFVGAGGTAHLNTYLFVVNAGGSLELNTVTRRFNAEVHGEICLLGGIKVAHVGACAGGEGHISSRGISVCFDILDGTWTPGVGYLYGQTVPTFFAGALGDGCKPSQFWEVNVRGARISAAPNAPLVFKVKPGEKAKTMELTGAGGAPAVTVVGPDGEQLASEANTMLHGKKLSAISAARFDRTWIGVEDAKPGIYKVIPAGGSAPIVNVRETRYEPEAGIEASVTGRGRHFVLHYDAGHAAGQTVSFYERGKDTWDLLKTVKGGKGQLAFEPSLGSAGRRSIAAQVEVAGIPGAIETLDHFKAPPPPRVGRVKGVRAIRQGSRLAVSWQKARYAQGYSVVTEASGGAVHTQRVKAKRHAATVKGVPATEAGRVEVVAFGPTGDRGKPSRARFGALRKPKTRMLPFKELGTGEAAGHVKKAKKKGKGARG
jgi:hypothetical protein